MATSSRIKKKILLGVYEDNAGIPRTHLGKRRSQHDADGQGRPYGTAAPVRWVLVVTLGLLAVFGLNVRLTFDDAGGPVAMQINPYLMPDMVPDPLLLVTGQADPEAQLDPYADTESERLLKEGSMFVHGYDTMLARLGMPVADLLDLKVGTIVIDPGHGGIDPGATGNQGLTEKDVTLDIARRLQKRLKRSTGYNVLMTREDDRKVFLKERVAFAKEHKADLFISIHVNSLPAEAASFNYVETYYFGPHSDQRSLELAQKENHDSDYALGDFREVIAKIGDTMKSEESGELALAIHGQLYGGLSKINNRLVDAGTKTGPFVVLLGVEVPSVLVEVTCISNIAEETRLSKAWYRDDIAAFLETGIVKYLDDRGYREPTDGGRYENVAKQ